eukprot:UN23237
MVEISAALGKLWSETSDKARTPFVNQSAKSKAKYDKEFETYRQTDGYTDFQKRRNLHNLIQKYVQKIPGAKKKNVYKQFPTDPNSPSQASTAFFLFANDNRDAMMKKNPDATMAEIGKMLGEAWKKVSATAKAKYQKQQQKSKDKYNAAVEKYEKTKK